MTLKPYMHKVQYYETDQMGIVHHSNYIRWFEEARIDVLEQIGASYPMLEENGILIPVLGVSCEYKDMVHFGESVYVLPKIENYDGIRMSVSYRVIDTVKKDLKTVGTSAHCFLDRNYRFVSVRRKFLEIHRRLETMTSITYDL